MKLFAAICTLLLMGGISRAQQASCNEQATYEHHNMVDYGPLKLSSNIHGSAIDPSAVAVSGACVFVFTEKEHQLVSTMQADADGKFTLVLKNGRYRIVVKASPLCAANIPVRILQGGNKNLVAHMKRAGMDSRSYGEAR
jgi:hypothetical protein